MARFEIFCKMNLKPVFILSVLMSSIIFGAFGQNERYFLPFIDSTSVENRCGYKNQFGDIIIPAKYPIIFYTDTLWQYNYLGTVTPNIIAFKHKDSMFFQPFICSKIHYSDGRLSRIEKNGKMGFVNEKNEIVIPPKYDFVTPFKDGFSEFYQGVDKVYMRGNWYWGGNIQTKGYLNEEGREFSKKTVELFENGNVKSILYRWTGNYSCLGGIESFHFYESGNLQSHSAYGTLFNCKPDYDLQYVFNESGDTVLLKNKTRQMLNGEYRIGHYDYYYDSTGSRVNEWMVIRSLWSNDSVLDFINDDLIFLNQNYREISEKKMIKKINKNHLDWVYTYLPQEVWSDTGAEIRFIIHPRRKKDKDRDRLKKAHSKVLRHWVSREFNRLIYHSESITIATLDSAGTNTDSEIAVSKRDHKKLVKLLYAESGYDILIKDLPEARIKITSYNGNKRKTILWVSAQSGDVYLERDFGEFIKLNHFDKLNRKVNRLLVKYKLM